MSRSRDKPSSLETGEIQFRDKWQFELKSDFFPISEIGKNNLIHEFYFFIPESLQINDQTYTKEEFYRDQTNLIRFKTPEFSFEEILDPNNKDSPLTRIREYGKKSKDAVSEEQVLEEIKLFANIFRSSIRERFTMLTELLDLVETQEKRLALIESYNISMERFNKVRGDFIEIGSKYFASWSDPIVEKYFTYIEEFISNLIHEYSILLLKIIRKKHHEDLVELDQMICRVIRDEKKYRERSFGEVTHIGKTSPESEYILYRYGLLNKFVLNPLLLKTSRASLDQKYKNFIGAFAAGIAMVAYVSLLILQGTVLTWNSQPFIIMTIIFYVLKDRIKDEIKAISFRKATQWFSDYETEIFPPYEGPPLGSIQESMSFVNHSRLPEEILGVRHREFHTVLEKLKRPERVIYYKRKVIVKQNFQEVDSRLQALNIFFRFDIHHLLAKAEDPFHLYLTLGEKGSRIKETRVPKIYHLNIIMKVTEEMSDSTKASEIKKYRLILDKTGIKRIEVV